MKRFDQYSSALAVLCKAEEQDLRNEFVQSGVIDKFAIQFELGWKMLKDLARFEGDAASATGSPRDILKAAYRYFDVFDEDAWLSMLRDRNAILHLYDGEALQRLLDRVLNRYIPAFVQLQAAVQDRYSDQLPFID